MRPRRRLGYPCNPVSAVVGRLAVLGDVEALAFRLVRHAQADDHLHDLEDDVRHHGVVHDGEADRLGLDDELRADARVFTAEALAAQRGRGEDADA